jgi:glycine/D-amino acid oxidase-like deaminating enzyme
MTESWRADELLPVAEKTYRELEKELGVSFYHPMPMVRLFPSAEERDANLKRLEAFEDTRYLSKVYEEWELPGLHPVKNGACEVKGAGYLDTELFLTEFRNWLQKTGRLAQAQVKYENIILSDRGVSINDISAENLIFCEGYYGARNPWFSYLPWNLCKGELLTIHAPGLDSSAILSRGIYIVPLDEDMFRVGATYSWEKLNNEPTAPAAKMLTDALDELVNVPYTVIDQKAGVRPTVRNRRPFLGRHPEFGQLAIFNGLGTKGVLLAPFFGKQMANYLEGKEGLDREVDIAQLAMSNKQ